MISTAMILAAGLGTRMRPLTDNRPKALVSVGGRTLIDRALDRLTDAGFDRIVVNVHHHADMLQAHLKGRADILFSDERDCLLETGGGVKKALPLLGDGPFVVANCDSLLLNGTQAYLDRLRTAWNDATMDGLLLCHRLAAAHGYDGLGDFTIDPLGRPERRAEQRIAPYVFTGTQILHPRSFEGTPEAGTPFSLNRVYNRLLELDRLCALVHDGEYYHVGTPAAVTRTEELMDGTTPISQQ